MSYCCLLVRASGKELDRLRGEAYRASRDTKIDWYAEPRDAGTAFCFESAEARTRFRAICTKENVDCTAER